ncbi:MAG: hypothetical protein AAFQ50_17550, partial [Pseudomonadota bacterium]
MAAGTGPRRGIAMMRQQLQQQQLPQQMQQNSQQLQQQQLQDAQQGQQQMQQQLQQLRQQLQQMSQQMQGEQQQINIAALRRALEAYEAEMETPFPATRAAQLTGVLKSMARAWEGTSARLLRQAKGAPADAGLGLVIQQMAFGAA